VVGLDFQGIRTLKRIGGVVVWSWILAQVGAGSPKDVHVSVFVSS
jgi:hypothetical protein